MKCVKLVLGFWILLTACTCLGQPNPVPYIHQPLEPGAVAPGATEFSVTVHGAGFVPASIVNWNGYALSTSFLNSSKLSAIVPAALVSSVGTARVTVVTPGPGGGSSEPVPFAIASPVASPVFRAVPVQGITTPIGTIAADFNGDGIPDLAVFDQVIPSLCNYQYHSMGSVGIFLGNGDGTFSAASTLCVVDLLGALPRNLAVVGDVNRDGKTDLVLASFSQGTDTVAVYYGNGNGTFSAPQELYPYTSAAMAMAAFAEPYSPYEVTGLALGDFYGNGKVNVAVSLLNTGPPMPGPNAQVFLLPQNNFLLNTFSPSGGAGPLNAGDFNGNGVLDLADASGMKIFVNDGNGQFTQLSGAPLGDGKSMAAGDFNGDGILDLVVTNGSTFSILLGNGDGMFTLEAGQPVSTQTNNAIIAADFNADGKLDLAAVDSTNVVSIYLGNGDGTFQAPIDTTGRGDSVVAADFNGDGRMDLAVTDSTQGTVTLLLQLQTPTVTFTGAPPSAAYGSKFTVAASSNGSSDAIIGATGACSVYSVSGSAPTASATIEMTSGSGTCNLSATWDADQNYIAASLTQRTLATRATQTITFGPISTQVQGVSLLLNATASSLLPVSYTSVTPSVCTVSAGSATLLKPGVCSIRATQAGDSDYLPATPVTANFKVSGFAINSVPASETVRAGTLAGFLLQIRAVNGFEGNVRLSCSGGPAKSVCATLPQTVHLGQHAIAAGGMLVPSGATPGKYIITFTASSGTAISSALSSLTVR